jgi:penicillin amidase
MGLLARMLLGAADRLGRLGVGRLWLRRYLPPTRERLALDGLQGEVEVRFDGCGIPHIYARSADDLFFAQGYCHARDRLFQMELNRLAARGELAEAFGPRAVEVDRFVRRLGFRRAAERELQSAEPATAQLARRYADGVNAFVARHRLPFEFAILRDRPRPWDPVDSLAFARYMTFTLSFNWESELIRGRLIARLGVEGAGRLEPGHPRRDPRRAGGEPDTADTWRALFTSADPPSAASLEALFASLGPGGASNNWVVAPERSATGRAMLANDPHLRPRMPAHWYLMHLCGGSFDVMGATFPGLLGVLIGHNARIGWGITATMADTQDLYLERADPAAPGRFAGGAGWEEAGQVVEEIRVRGREQPVIERFFRTRHGPLLNGLAGIPADGPPLALRNAADDCSSPTDALLGLNQAGNWEEFRAALAGWQAPVLNFVYADVDGAIGYQMAGRVPIRSQGDGTLPLPGWTGEHEWRGWVPFDELPRVFRPPQSPSLPDGIFATANTEPLLPCHHLLTADWLDDHRQRRVYQLLRGKPVLSLEDMCRIQNDLLSLPAAAVVEHLKRVVPRDEAARRALELVLSWDGQLLPDSAAAAIYQVFRHEFVRHFHRALPAALREYVLGRGVHELLASVSVFHHKAGSYLLGYLAECSASPPGSGPLVEAFHAAIRWLETELGPDPAGWQWGRLHTIAFSHPIGLAAPLLDRLLRLSRGPIPLGGDADTVPQAGVDPWHPYTAALFTVSYRQVLDVGDWDQSLFALPTGQSGQPGSDHYDDLLEDWRTGRYRRLLFTRQAVEADTAEQIWLTPR